MDLALLDTDILSEMLKQRDPHILKHARQYFRSHGQFALSAVTRFEIVRGYKHVGATVQLANFATFCGHSFVVPLTDSTFDRAADLWVLARQRGHTAGDADLLIAATAIEHGRRLVTGNHAHFAWIPGLLLADWRQP